MQKGLRIYIDQVDSHVHLRVFFNGGLCGKLVLRTEEFFDFIDELELKLRGFLDTDELSDYFVIYRDDERKLNEIRKRLEEESESIQKTKSREKW